MRRRPRPGCWALLVQRAEPEGGPGNRPGSWALGIIHQQFRPILGGSSSVTAQATSGSDHM